jgi:hypothetical protein
VPGAFFVVPVIKESSVVPYTIDEIFGGATVDFILEIVIVFVLVENVFPPM